jgi:hypothetical protein
MRISVIARFMQMNGAISGWRDGIHWFRLPGGKTPTIGNVFGYRYIGRSGLRIASTVVAREAAPKQSTGDAHAPGGAPDGDA